jgi:hypothetical protein
MLTSEPKIALSANENKNNERQNECENALTVGHALIDAGVDLGYCWKKARRSSASLWQVRSAWVNWLDDSEFDEGL